MLDNDHEILAAYDELEMIFNMLAKGNESDRRQLLSLEGGGEWCRDFKCASGDMFNTSFNLTGELHKFLKNLKHATTNCIQK